MPGIEIMKITASEKSVDGTGGIQRGTFIKGTETYANSTLVSGAVYDSTGAFVGLESEGVWTAA